MGNSKRVDTQQRGEAYVPSPYASTARIRTALHTEGLREFSSIQSKAAVTNSVGRNATEHPGALSRVLIRLRTHLLPLRIDKLGGDRKT